MQQESRLETDSNGRRTRLVQLLGLSMGHALNDAYVNFIAPLWPQIKALFNLTNSDIGVITMWWGLTTNLGQPILGYLTDRWRPKRLVVVATLISTVFFSFIGYARTLPMFIAFLVLGGIGVALFHPRGAALAVAISGRRRAFGMGIFAAGGSVGFAIGYLCAPYLHNLTGDMTGLVYAAPVGVIGAIVLLLINAEGKPAATQAVFHLREHVLPYLGQITPLLIVMILRSSAVVAFANFIPLMLSAQGRTLVQGGYAGFYFVAGGAIGGIVAGHISDRLGRRGITILTLLISPLFLYYALEAAALPSLTAFFGMLFLSGLVTRAAEPVNITHTQEMLPQGASLAASLGMGGAWGVAGLVAPLVGRLSDLHGVEYALGWVVWIPVLAAMAALFIPKGSSHRAQTTGAD